MNSNKPIAIAEEQIRTATTLKQLGSGVMALRSAYKCSSSELVEEACEFEPTFSIDILNDVENGRVVDIRFYDAVFKSLGLSDLDFPIIIKTHAEASPPTENTKKLDKDLKEKLKQTPNAEAFGIAFSAIRKALGHTHRTLAEKARVARDSISKLDHGMPIQTRPLSSILFHLQLTLEDLPEHYLNSCKKGNNLPTTAYIRKIEKGGYLEPEDNRGRRW